MAKLMPTGKQQYFDTNGNPLSGGKIYTFEAGSTTPKATYSDASGSTPNANPVILDARGEALIFWDGVYDVQVKDSSGNLIYSVPNYSAQNDAASVSYGGAALDSILKNGTGKVVSSISVLRAIDKTKNTKAFVTGYYADGDGGGGAYYYDAADTTSTDNGGTIIVASDGGRWKLAATSELSVAQFGVKSDSNATGTTGTDDTTAWKAALAYVSAAGTPKKLRVPFGSTGYSKITSQLEVANVVTINFDSTACTLVKCFNGNLLKLTSGLITLNNISIAGNGATYTGAGIHVAAGTTNNITVNNPRILDTNDSAIVFDGGSGESFNCYGGYLIPTSAAVHAVRVIPSSGWDDPLNPRNRSFMNVSSSGRKLIDLTGMVTTYIFGGQCAGITFNNGSVSPALPSYVSAKAVIAGVRATVGFDIDGQDHRVSDINFGAVAPSGTYNVTFAATASGCGVANCATPFGVMDYASGLGGNTNRFDTFEQAYSCAWQASSVNPSIGNGTLTAKHCVDGRRVSVSILLQIGSTTSTGTGSWKFTLPYQAAADSGGGTVRALRSGVAFRTGVAVIQSTGSPSSFEIYSDNTGTAWGNATPVTWGSGDYMTISFEYTRA